MKLRTLATVLAASAIAVQPLHPAAAPATAPGAAHVDRLLAARIKHVFIIYQENRSFDAEFGTFPGANGVWSSAARAHGFRQIDPVTGKTVTPFRLTDPDVYYESNSRGVQLHAFDGGKMDRFVAEQGKAVLAYEKNATPQQRFSVGAEAMYHLDCDTIPYLWAYAKRFTLLDNFYQALRGPSTPSNIEIIAAQNGLTEYARSPHKIAKRPAPGDPVFTDLDPPYGPYNPADASNPKQTDQTYANVLLTMQRKDVKAVTQDTHNVRRDKTVIAKLPGGAIPWRWYEEGYRAKQHAGLVAHHLAPQYFGYVVKNSSMVSNMRDITGFYTDLAQRRLRKRRLLSQRRIAQYAGPAPGKSGSVRAEDVFGRRRSSGVHRFADIAGVRRFAGFRNCAQQLLERQRNHHRMGRSRRVLGSRAPAQLRALPRWRALRRRRTRSGDRHFAVREDGSDRA